MAGEPGDWLVSPPSPGERRVRRGVRVMRVISSLPDDGAVVRPKDKRVMGHCRLQ